MRIGISLNLENFASSIQRKHDEEPKLVLKICINNHYIEIKIGLFCTENGRFRTLVRSFNNGQWQNELLTIEIDQSPISLCGWRNISKRLGQIC